MPPRRKSRVSDRVPKDSVQSTQNAIEQQIEEAANEQHDPVPPSTEKNRLYALLIGIDEYARKGTNLSGAVRDAERMKSLLLGLNPPVNENRIKFLKNCGAKSQQIIAEIRKLGTNDDIQKDDPILIYYAGHGCSVLTPAGWPAGSRYIQCLSPYDANISKEKVEPPEVQGVITGRTFGALLQDLAKAKGDNITVILDSCHSGGATRKSNRDAPSTARGVVFKDGNKECTVNPSYQKDIWKGREDGQSARGLVTLPVFAYGGLRSHVVLAACGPDEYAWEDRVRDERNTFASEGRFTSALIREVKTRGPDTMTCGELIRRLGRLPSQTPQCEGNGKDRLLFQSGLVKTARSHYTVERVGSSCVMHAGQVNGVCLGDTYAIYSNPTAAATFNSARKLGEFLVESVRPVTSILSTNDFDLKLLDESSTATLTRVGKRGSMHLHVHRDLKRVVAQALSQEVVESAKTMESAKVPEYNFVVSRARTAVLSLVPVGSNEIAFEILDSQIRGYGLERLEGTVPLDAGALRTALHAAAHFFYHLYSAPLTPVLKRMVRATVQPVIYGLDHSTQTPIPSWLPDGPPVDFQSPELGAFYPKVSLPKDEQRTCYGVNVGHMGAKGVDLYIWMFYFDCRTLEIHPFYEPPEGSKSVMPSLRASDGMMPLNYGDAGNEPLTFEMPEERNVDVGFLRIFLSTRKADLSNIAQEPFIGGRSLGHVTSGMLIGESWDAMTLAVVQRWKAEAYESAGLDDTHKHGNAGESSKDGTSGGRVKGVTPQSKTIKPYDTTTEKNLWYRSITSDGRKDLLLTKTERDQRWDALPDSEKEVWRTKSRELTRARAPRAKKAGAAISGSSSHSNTA